MEAARNKIGKVLQDMVLKLLMTKPEEPVPHMLQILQDMQGTGKPPLTKDEKMELSELREEYKKLKALKKKAAESSDSEQEDDGGTGTVKIDGASSSDSEGEELDEVNDGLSPVKHQDQIQMA